MIFYKKISKNINHYDKNSNHNIKIFTSYADI